MKICVIDDEFAVRSGVIFKLNSLNKPVEVFDAGYGASALDKVRKIRPDIVITDIMMPGLDGLEMLRILKEELPTARVFLLTGYSEFEYARKAIQLGASGYLLKPAVVEELLQLVEGVEQEGAGKLESDFRRYHALLKERHLYMEPEELRLPSVWYDEALPKRILLALDPKELLPEYGQAVVTFRLKRHIYGAVVRADWSEKGCFSRGDEFVAALLQAADSWESDRFFSGSGSAGRRGGESQLRRSAVMRQAILQAVKDLQAAVVESQLCEFLDHIGQLELKQLRKECAYLMASLDETMTAKHDINIVEEDKLAYWTSWVAQHASWEELKRSVHKFVGGGTRALAELESAHQPTVLVEKAMQLVSKYKGANINLESVAAALSVHAVTLSRIFKQQTGENFIRYAVRQKMKQAERLLRESDKKIGEIAEEAGYADFRYFSHLFKQAYGMSPSEYRKRQQGSLD